MRSSDGFLSHCTPAMRSSDGILSHCTPAMRSSDDFLSRYTPAMRSPDGFLSRCTPAMRSPDDFLSRCTPVTELTSLSGRTGGARYLLHNHLLASVDVNTRSSRLLRKLNAVDSVPRSRVSSIGSFDIVYSG